MNPLIDFDLDSFDPLAQKPAPQPQYAQQPASGGGNLLDFGDFGSSLPAADDSQPHHRGRVSDEEDDYDRDRRGDSRAKSGRRNKYDDDDEDDYDRDRDDRDRGRHRREDSSGSGMKININIARPGEKRETTTRKSGDRVQRSVAGGARASSPLRSSDLRGSKSKYDDYDEPSDNEEDRYGKHRYDSKPSRSKYDVDDDYGASSNKYGAGSSSSRGRSKYDDDEDEYGSSSDRYGSGSGRRYEGFGSSDYNSSKSRGGRGDWDDDYGSGGGSSWDRPESWHCYRARAWESYTNEITGMEYAVDKTPENRIIFTLESEGMRVERESDGKTMFYDYRNIAKINHKHGQGDNFLNFLMKDDRMITISNPETVEIKKKLLEKVKRNAGLKLGNYKSKRGSYADYY